jgi:hypothetical protein
MHTSSHWAVVLAFAWPCLACAGDVSPDGKWKLTVLPLPAGPNDYTPRQLVISNLEDKSSQKAEAYSGQWGSHEEDAIRAHWRSDSLAFVISDCAKRHDGFSLYVCVAGRWYNLWSSYSLDKEFSIQKIWHLSDEDYDAITESGEEFLGWSHDGGIRWRGCLGDSAYPTVFRAKIVAGNNTWPQLIYIDAEKEPDKK